LIFKGYGISPIGVEIIMEMPEVEIVDPEGLTPELLEERHRIIRALWWGETWPGNLVRERSYAERYLFVKGSSPVILTAPHAVPHDRGNYNGKNLLKPQDEFTDLIVLRVCQEAKCFGLIPLTKLRDPNVDNFDGLRARETPFLRCLEGLISSYDIQLLLDLHGLDRKRRGIDIEIGTRYGRSLRGRREILEQLEKHLRREADYLIRKNRSFIGGEIVRNIMERIPAIQLEIHRRLRDDGHSVEMERLIGILTDFVKSLPFDADFASARQ
jgi:hypothetical protein